jgi:hypothetical protein
MLLMFCSSEFDPRPLDTSVVYLCDCAIPSWASVDTVFPVNGTADIQPGPKNPLRFGSYRLSYASADSQTSWHPIGVAHSAPVHNDTLETWDTHGLATGPYVLKMTLTNSNGDSIEPTKSVNLGYATVADSRQLPANSPQPLPTMVRRVLNLQSAMCNLQSEIALLDISGRQVTALHPGPNDLSGLAPGIYFVHATAPGERMTHKLVLTR